MKTEVEILNEIENKIVKNLNFEIEQMKHNEIEDLQESVESNIQVLKYGLLEVTILTSIKMMLSELKKMYERTE